jgi:hypothetical protein
MLTCDSPICSYFHSCSAWPICAAATIALGLCHFGCILLLPHLHSLLYAVNAAGFVLGVLGASVIVRRVGTLNSLGIAFGACVLSLAVSTLTTQLTVLGIELARLGAVP